MGISLQLKCDPAPTAHSHTAGDKISAAVEAADRNCDETIACVRLGCLFPAERCFGTGQESSDYTWPARCAKLLLGREAMSKKCDSTKLSSYSLRRWGFSFTSATVCQ